MSISVWKRKEKSMNSLWKLALTKLFSMIVNINFLKYIFLLIILVNLTACGSKAASQDVSVNLNQIHGGLQTTHGKLSRQISEVSPPVVIQKLRQNLEAYQPQVKIITPKSQEVLQDNFLKVKFRVKDLPVFKNSHFGLGPHLQVILDNEQYEEIYDLDRPLEIPNLSAGTHTLQVFASSPWDESFKNEGAYDQVTFHVFTKSDSNNPDPGLPLLTYSSPRGEYGAEPILLDFYLTNAPLHLVAQEEENQKIGDWRIRCTVNGESFVLDRWQSLYLQGFKSGKNWIKLEFLDGKGNPIKNVFNGTIRTITYNPKGKGTLSQITRGELKAEELLPIIDPKYVVEKPVVKEPIIKEPILKEPVAKEPILKPAPKVETKPTPKTTPTTEVKPQAKQPSSTPAVEPPASKVIESPTPEVKPAPSPTISPAKPKETPQTSPKAINPPAVVPQSHTTSTKPGTEKTTPEKETKPEVKADSKADLPVQSAPKAEAGVKEATAKPEKVETKDPKTDQKTIVPEGIPGK